MTSGRLNLTLRETGMFRAAIRSTLPETLDRRLVLPVRSARADRSVDAVIVAYTGATMAGEITLLHLSDFHFGQQVAATRWRLLLDALKADLEFLTGASSTIDLVVISGDIAYSGAVAEFAMAEDQLERLLTGLPGGSPPVIAVPGNHDLERPANDPLASLVVSAPDAFAEGLERALRTGHGDPYVAVPRRALSNYERWVSDSRLLLRPELTGLLPGDARYRFDTGDLCLDFMCLNTTFGQLAPGDHKGKLHVAASQIDEIAGSEKAPDGVVLVTHQPLNWLTAGARATVGELVFGGSSGAVIHLYGHMHERNLSASTADGANHMLSVQGASFFGLDVFESQSNRRHGYSLLRVARKGTSLVAQVAPRRGTVRSRGGGSSIATYRAGSTFPRGATSRARSTSGRLLIRW